MRQGFKSDVRTSSGMFLNYEQRKHLLVQIFCVFSSLHKIYKFEKKHRYEKDEYYKPHFDYFSDTAGNGSCSCGGQFVKGLSVKPVKGDAVLFWSMGLDGKSDPKSLHGGCGVLNGEKCATKAAPHCMKPTKKIK
ncbi:hypothetical protein QJS04_geneDACA004402 [Acorus gramineus]|uniref:Prolyl 4-hydroxylase alpha subunit Fe(2+) 2OG dioxygenase domain-containing protein n=1 Tax=Acorus gramineus TaxID=55184 RepID=A0AAV9B5H9_ACOGR|nr:hypothetical protein QJS04_geneDACA004402 [Acorus gramineus]